MCLLAVQNSFAQNSFKAIIRDKKTKETLIGATISIETLKIGATSDEKGVAILNNIPNGEFIIQFRSVGYQENRTGFKFPLPSPNDIVEIELETKDTDLGEITVSTTRSSRSIKDIPTRIEAITLEELDEKASMKPGDIKMLLNESTGIATQQTSAVSGTANVRIQGLDGRYTQFLRDGMPLYQGFSGGLSVMQITPLDLKQVEFIKGSASTLFGGGAIAGLVNLISKTPREQQELNFLLNGTSAKGFDASGFYSKKGQKIGTTIFSSYNFNAPYDPAKIDLTAIPQTNRFTFNPKLFLYLTDKTSGWLGVNTVFEDRFGGDLNVIAGKKDNTHQYFERNKSVRLSYQMNFTHQFNDKQKLDFKNTIGFFERNISLPSSQFKGQQVSSFSELSYSKSQEKSEWIAGGNLWTDKFSSLESPNVDYNLTTFGGFVQNTFKANEWFSVETGVRIDANTPKTKDKGVFVLPRINGIFKINEHFTSRIGGGMGYKMPSIFSEAAEASGFKAIQPLNFATTYAEKSYGGNADINYRSQFDEISLSINQLFFYTYLNRPLILTGNNYQNANGFINTKGAETNIKIRWEALHFFAGYTFTDAKLHFNNTIIEQLLTSKHRLNAVLMFEKENEYRIGLEGLYVSKQQLSDGTTGKEYIMFGFLAEKMWEHFNVFFNAENFTDRRQTRWDKVFTGSITNPVFRDIYAPTDGIVLNLGIKIKL